MKIRILNAPGLADTRGVHQDELHKESIETEIQHHIDSVTAVLILVNGSVPRIIAGMDYPLSALSALLPKTLARKIGTMLSGSPTHHSLNGSQGAIPRTLEDARQFLLDNPIALQEKYLGFKDDSKHKTLREEIRNVVKDSEQDALEMLVNFFDWLNSLELPQPTTDIVALYNKSHAIETKITHTLTQIDQASMQIAEINKLVEELQKKSAVSFTPNFHLMRDPYARWT